MMSERKRVDNWITQSSALDMQLLYNVSCAAGSPPHYVSSVELYRVDRIADHVDRSAILDCAEVADRVALIDRADHPAHDLAATGLGQCVHKMDRVRCGDRADPVAHQLPDLLRHDVL